jgi:hypothetical protein
LEEAEKQKEKVREWALKKMVAQFNNHKKRHYKRHPPTATQLCVAKCPY